MTQSICRFLALRFQVSKTQSEPASEALRQLVCSLFYHSPIATGCAIRLEATSTGGSGWQTLMTAFLTIDYRTHGCIKLLSIVLLVDTERKSSHRTCQGPLGGPSKQKRFSFSCGNGRRHHKIRNHFHDRFELTSSVANLLRRTKASRWIVCRRRERTRLTNQLVVQLAIQRGAA